MDFSTWYIRKKKKKNQPKSWIHFYHSISFLGVHNGIHARIEPLKYDDPQNFLFEQKREKTLDTSCKPRSDLSSSSRAASKGRAKLAPAPNGSRARGRTALNASAVVPTGLTPRTRRTKGANEAPIGPCRWQLIYQARLFSRPAPIEFPTRRAYRHVGRCTDVYYTARGKQETRTVGRGMPLIRGGWLSR